MSIQLFNGQNNPLSEQILEYEKSLFSPCKKSSLDACVSIISQFKDLTDVVNRALSLNVSEEKASENQLIKTEVVYYKTYQALKSREENLRDLKVKSKVLKSKKTNLEEAIDKVKRKEKKLKKKIRESRVSRSDALIDMVPLVGIFTGLITGRYMRMIPFYSSTVGLISVCKRDLESYKTTLSVRKTEQNLLESEISINSRVLKKNRKAFSASKKKLYKLDEKKQKLELKTKETGKALTELRNVNMSLNELILKYNFLQLDIHNIKEDIEEDFLPKEMIQNFIADVKNIQTTHFQLSGNLPVGS